MKKIKQFSFRSQIFLSSMILVIIPSTLLGLYAANNSTQKISLEYETSISTLMTQMNSSLDTLLQEAVKIADMPLLSDDVKRALTTNYKTDYLSYAQDSSTFRYYFRQTNRLNTNLLSCAFLGRYGYWFEYNILTVQHRNTIEENIGEWEKLARNSSTHTYFAPLQTSGAGNSGKYILPMTKIILDGYDYTELGICYCEINFEPVVELLSSSKDTDNTLFIYTGDGDLIYSSNSIYMTQQEKQTSLLSSLADFNDTLSKENEVTTSTISTDYNHFTVNGCINQTTQWHLIQLVDNETMTQVYQSNYYHYVFIFGLSVLLGLILAIFLSMLLTRSVSKLCKEIDYLSPTKDGQIDEKACGSNQELLKLVISFNRMNQRLTQSLQQNYQIRINEQRMEIQMLQFQINHHFLYNTLNIIKSLANIHNIPEIETVSTCMSDLIRYNLEKFPVASLEEELQQVKRYLTIQDIRFPGKFCFDINIPSELLKIQIPVFLLQPLVENCIEHGFANRENNCYISISCQIDPEYLRFLIADNGTGMSQDQLLEITNNIKQSNETLEDKQTHHSIGLKNVNARIKNYYGINYGLSIESMIEEGTIIEITLPASAFEHCNTHTT